MKTAIFGSAGMAIFLLTSAAHAQTDLDKCQLPQWKNSCAAANDDEGEDRRFRMLREPVKFPGGPNPEGPRGPAVPNEGPRGVDLAPAQ